MVAAGGATEVKSPIIPMPKVSRLNPPACAAITERARPPARPSNTVPYRSTRTL